MPLKKDSTTVLPQQLPIGSCSVRGCGLHKSRRFDIGCPGRDAPGPVAAVCSATRASATRPVPAPCPTSASWANLHLLSQESPSRYVQQTLPPSAVSSEARALQLLNRDRHAHRQLLVNPVCFDEGANPVGMHLSVAINRAQADDQGDVYRLRKRWLIGA